MKESLASLKREENLGHEKIAFTNARLLTGEEVLDHHALIVEEGIIVAVCKQTELPDGIRSIDLEGACISAGFIDLQLNGCGGVMFNDAVNIETLEMMHQTNLKSGCTSFLPTLITSSDEDMKHAVYVMRDYQMKYPNHSLGLHIEGPYISLSKKGIHNPKYIRRADDEMLNFLCAHSAQIAKLTLAPEVCSPDIVRRLDHAGIVVSIGHSNATYEEAKAAVLAGATFGTHLYNAMSVMQGREPGVLGAIYNSESLYTGVIADGIHVDFSNIRIAKKIKGDHLILVTDGTAAAGAPELTSFDFVGETVYVKDGKCINKDGTIGGSALTLDRAVYNSIRHTGISLEEAVRMVTLYPARAIKQTSRIGLLKAGLNANLTIFDDKINILATLVDQQLIKVSQPNKFQE